MCSALKFTKNPGFHVILCCVDCLYSY